MFCQSKQKHFIEYRYVPVIWSGDSLPVCPYCNKSPYESDFRQTHQETDDLRAVNDE